MIENNFLYDENKADDEIDFKSFIKNLKRRYKLITITAGLALVISAIYAKNKEYIWQGQFEIVISSEPTELNSLNLVSKIRNSNAFATEVKILESPYVLKPVFDFVKQEKSILGKDVSKWRFSSWRKNHVKVSLEKGTSIVKLSYKDNDKDLIKPVLEKISNEYQLYSGRDREKGMLRAVNYLKSQVKVYKDLSSKSLLNTQKYSIKYNLSPFTGESSIDNEISVVGESVSERSDTYLGLLEIEKKRLLAANLMNSIQRQLEQLNSLDDDPEQIMYLSNNISELKSQGLTEKLKVLDLSLVELRSKYLDNDRSVQDLLKKREIIITSLRRQARGFLNAKLTEAKQMLVDSERPKGVLTKYKELIRESIRNKNTLTRLESALLTTTLEKEKTQAPWELISNPTVLDHAVEPNKMNIVLIGSLLGLTLGIILSLCLDVYSNLIFGFEEFDRRLPYRFLLHIKSNDRSRWEKYGKLLASGELLNSNYSNIAILYFEEKLSSEVKDFLSVLDSSLKDLSLVITSDVTLANKSDTQLLLVSPGKITRDKLRDYLQELKLEGSSVYGWIYID